MRGNKKNAALHEQFPYHGALSFWVIAVGG